jgi:hypothetical protein
MNQLNEFEIQIQKQKKQIHKMPVTAHIYEYEYIEYCIYRTSSRKILNNSNIVYIFLLLLLLLLLLYIAPLCFKYIYFFVMLYVLCFILHYT